MSNGHTYCPNVIIYCEHQYFLCVLVKLNSNPYYGVFLSPIIKEGIKVSVTTSVEKNFPFYHKGGYREIITKAVCGTAKKHFRYSQQLSTVDGSEPTQILGTSITQMRLKDPEIEADNDKIGVRVNGIFEVHIWYAHNGGKATDLLRQAIHFEEVIPVTEYDGQILSITDAKATVFKAPQTQEAVITKEGKIKVDFELGMYVEVTGETKILVKVVSPDEV